MHDWKVGCASVVRELAPPSLSFSARVDITVHPRAARCRARARLFPAGSWFRRAQASSLRRRRPASTSESGGSRATSVRATSSASRGDLRLVRRALGYRRFFALLFLPRAVSAAINLVHDCDETFNFWEPLHYLVYGHGLQTWEHSPVHALRSYLYLSLHYAVAKPVALLAGDARGKLLVFTLVRLVLGVASAASEAWLCAETAALSPVAGGVLAALLAGSAGMFAAGTRSSRAHSPCLLTIAAAATLARRHRISCAACVLAVVWGWPFAGLAALPMDVAGSSEARPWRRPPVRSSSRSSSPPPSTRTSTGVRPSRRSTF